MVYYILAPCALTLPNPLSCSAKRVYFSFLALFLMILVIIAYCILSSVYKVLPVLIQLVLTTNLWECHHYHSHFKGEETGVLRVNQIVQNYKALYPKKSDFKFGLITIILDCFSATGSQDQAFILALSTSSILSST